MISLSDFDNFFEWFWYSSSMKVLTIGTMVCSIMFCFGIAMQRFNPTDKIPELQIIDAAKQKEFGQLTAKVKTGLFIKNFSEFDVKKNSFICDCIVWFEFNSDEVMLSTIESFALDNGDVLSRSEPDVRIDGNKTIANYNVKLSFKANLNFHNFPIEGHRVALVLTNNFVTPRELFFTVDNGSFRIADGLFIADWVIRDTSTDAGFSVSALDRNDQTKLSSRPQVAFVINVDSKGIRKFLIIFMPILIAIFLSMFSFVAGVAGNKASQQRQVLPTAAITAIIGYRFVIESILPQVGYFTTTDYFFLFMLMVAFWNFVFQTLFIWHLNHALSLTGSALAESMHKFRVINTLAFLVSAVVTTVGIGVIVLR